MNDYNPTRSLQQVYLGSLDDPSGNISGMLNPESLRIALSVSIGKLHPVGSSHPVLQYGYTDGVSLPLEFYFSSQFQERLGGTAILDLPQYVHWFSAFCYPREKGAAPELLYMVWPNVLDMTLVVEKFNAEYTRFFNNDLRASAVKVSIDTLEYRISFKSAVDQRYDGFRRADAGLKKYYGTGGRLRLGK